MKILVVDDFSMVRYLLKSNLRELHLNSVDEAGSGEVALQMLREAARSGDPYELLFCDWNMPQMSGMQVLEACKSDPLLRDLSFIMITADGDPGSASEAKAAGAEDYLVKPWIATTLHNIVNRFRETTHFYKRVS